MTLYTQYISLSAVLLLTSACAAQSACSGYGNPATDWLTSQCPTTSTLTPLNGTGFLLSNGIVSRTLLVNATTGQMYTASLKSEATGTEKLAGVVPETELSVNGQSVAVGGLLADGPLRFTYVGYRTGTPLAGNFTFTPGSRGSRPNRSWPPKGLRVEFDHTLACAHVGQGNGSINATIVYELYDGTSAFSKRVLLSHTCPFPLFVFNMSVSALALARDGNVDTYTDAAIAEGAIMTMDGQQTWVNRFQPITASHSYDAFIPEFGPGLSAFTPQDRFASYLCVEVMHDGTPPQPTDPHGMSRYGLEISRAFRVLAPQIEQYPLAGDAMCIGGQNLTNDPAMNSWCYDTVGTAGLLAYIDQAAALGWELMSISVNMNQTWRSQIGVEFQSPQNVTWFKGIVDYAKSKGVEVGVYQLLRNARSATAINQCAPQNAAQLPLDGFDDMDLLPPYGTGRPCHNGGNQQCQGGPGCCSLCASSEWFTQMTDTVLDFWDGTGITMIEQDGAESNSPCANVSHVGHHGLNDSVWMKYNRVHDVFRAYLDRDGFVIGMPGHFFEGGQSKLPGGYDEMTWSLPRWTWIHRQRERMISDPQFRDRTLPNAVRYYVTPFTPYHPEEASGNSWVTVLGRESSATLEPLDSNLLELDWAMSQCFGTGIFCHFRGYRLFQSNASFAIMQKWTTFAKQYRTILGTDYITLNVGTVCWGSGSTQPNDACTVSTWDAILHWAPAAFYPDITERGLAMVWNPLNQTLAGINITMPLYYAGLSPGASVAIRQEEGTPTMYTLDAASNVTLAPVTLPPLSITYFVVESA